MKKIVTVTEVEGEGLESLLGEQVILFCMNYFYYGKLTGVNDTFCLLEEGGIVYETGAFTDAKYKDAQPLGRPLYVVTDKIEAFARGK